MPIRDDQPEGDVRVMHCTVRHLGPVLQFDVVIKDQHGRRWITDHQVFRFDFERIPE